MASNAECALLCLPGLFTRTTILSEMAMQHKWLHVLYTAQQNETGTVTYQDAALVMLPWLTAYFVLLASTCTLVSAVLTS